MKKTTVRAALAAALSLGFMATAEAVPLYFDFTGSIQDGTGTAVSGGFTLETDRLFGSNPVPNIYSWVDWQPANLAEPLAQISFGDQSFAFPAGAGTNYVVLNFNDACTAAGCEPQQIENWSLFAYAADREVLPGFTGSYTARSFYFSSLAFLTDPPFPQGFDYFDGAQLDPTAIVSLPLYTMFGFFGEDHVDCVDGECTATGSTSFSFSIDSVTRGLGVRSVPEPGTLGLLGAGMLATLLVRRRRKPELSPGQQRA